MLPTWIQTGPFILGAYDPIAQREAAYYKEMVRKRTAMAAQKVPLYNTTDTESDNESEPLRLDTKNNTGEGIQLKERSGLRPRRKKTVRKEREKQKKRVRFAEKISEVRYYEKEPKSHSKNEEGDPTVLPPKRADVLPEKMVSNVVPARPQWGTTTPTEVGVRKKNYLPLSKQSASVIFSILCLTGLVLTGVAMAGRLGENFLSKQPIIGSSFLIPETLGLAGSVYMLISTKKRKKENFSSPLTTLWI